MDGYIHASIDSINVVTLADTGAKLSVIKQEFLNRLPDKWQLAIEPPSIPSIRVATGKQAQIIGQIELPIKIGDMHYFSTFLILPELSLDLVLGIDFLRLTKARLDMESDRITFCHLRSAAWSEEEVPKQLLKPEIKATKAHSGVVISNLQAVTTKQRVYLKPAGFSELPLISNILPTPMCTIIPPSKLPQYTLKRKTGQHVSNLGKTCDPPPKIRNTTRKKIYSQIKDRADQTSNKFSNNEGQVVYLKVKAFPTGRRKKLSYHYDGPHQIKAGQILHRRLIMNKPTPPKRKIQRVEPVQILTAPRSINIDDQGKPRFSQYKIRSRSLRDPI